MRHGAKQDPPAEALHLRQELLDFTPLDNRGLEPFKLFFGEGHTHGFAFDLARPLIAWPARARATVLDVALTDPADLGQAAAQLGILCLPKG